MSRQLNEYIDRHITLGPGSYKYKHNHIPAIFQHITMQSMGI